jgi:TP901 family phage tail tape measure protein
MVGESVNLGTLSIALKANLIDFNSKLTEATKKLEAFQKAAQAIKIDIAPPKIDIASIQKAFNAELQKMKLTAPAPTMDATGLTKQMGELQRASPNLDFFSKLDKSKGLETASQQFTGLATNAQNLAGSITATGVDINKSLGSTVTQLTAFKDAAGPALNEFGKNVQPLLGQGESIRASFDKTGKLVVGSWSKSWKSAEGAMGNSVAGMRKHAGKLEEFIGGITHYITFSIGVQMVMAIKQGFTQAIQSFLAFEKVAANVAAISGRLGGAFDDVREHVEMLSKAMTTKVLFSATDVANTLYTLASAGYEVVDMTENDLIPIFEYAQATQSDLAQATESLITVLKAFRLEISDLAEVTDILTAASAYTLETMDRLKEGMKYVAPIAGELGLSLADTTAAMSSLVDRGEEGGQAGQRLAMILSKLLKPTDEAAADLNAMGLEMEDLDPTIHSLVEILLQLRAAGFGVAEATDMFRSRTAGSAAVLVQNAEAISYLATRLEMATGFTEAMAKAQGTTLAGQVQLAQQALQNLSLELGESLAPIILEITKGTKDILLPALKTLGSIFQFVSKNATLFKGVLAALVGIFSIWIAKVKIMPGLNLAWAASTGVLADAHAVMTSALILENGEEVVNIGLLNAESTSALGAAGAFTMLSTALKAVPGLGWMIAGIGLASGLLVSFALSSDKATASTAKSVKEFTKEENALNNMVVKLERGNKTVHDAALEIQADIADVYGKVYRLSGGFDPRKIIDALQGGKSTYKEFYDYIKANPISLGSFKGEEGLQQIEDILSGIRTKVQAKEAIQPFFIDTSNLDVSQFDAFISSVGELTEEQRGLIDVFLKAEVGSDAANDAIQKLSETGYQYAGTVANMHDQANSWADAQKQLIYATEELDAAQKAYDAGGQTNLEIQTRLFKATQNYTTANRGLIKVIGSLVQSLRALPGNIDFYVAEMEKASEAEAKAASLSRDLETLRRNEATALKDLTDALLTYGSGSDEAITAQEHLNATIKETVQTEDQIASLNLDMATSSDIVSKALKGEAASYAEVDGELKHLNQEEKDVLTFVQGVIDARDSLIQALSDQAEAEANLEVIEKVRAEGEKYMNDKLLKLYQTEDKIYGIEADLYKLRKDENKQVDALFDSLASQGMITGDMVDKYKEMKMAEGDLMKLNKGFSEVLQSLTPDQQKWATQLMKSAKGSEDYNTALEKLNELGVTDIDTIISMKDAQDNLTKALGTVEDGMNPVLEQLVQMGLISSDAASKYYDLIDNTAELAAGNQDLTNTQSDLGDNFSTLVNIIGQMGKSLVTGEKGSENFTSILDDLAEQLGVGEIGVDELNSLLGTHYKYVTDATDGELSMAYALKVTGTNMGVYQQGISGIDLATKLMIVNQDKAVDEFDKLKEAANTSINPLDTYAGALSKVDVQAGITKTAIDALKTSVKELNEEIAETSLPTYETPEEKARKDYVNPSTGGYVPIWRKAMGGVVKAQLGGMMKNSKWSATPGLNANPTGILKGPRMVMAGEAGDEAFIPLTGHNKKKGAAWLKYILPRYFPDLLGPVKGGPMKGNGLINSIDPPMMRALMGMQTGGIVTGGSGGPVASTYSEVYTINGPITVTGVQDVNGFMNQLKFNARLAGGK